MATLRDIDPIQALEVLSTRLYPRPPAQFPIEKAPGGFLAHPLDLESFEGAPLEDKTATRPAARNGYALPRGVREGDSCRVLGTIFSGGFTSGRTVREEALASSSSAAEGGPAEPEIWRVETGAPLPAEAVRILTPADAAIVGTGRIRVLRLPQEGHDAPGTKAGPASGSLHAPGPFAEGTPLDARLRAILQARGVREVTLRPPFPVGFATIGDELIDLSTSREPDSRHDVIAPALEHIIEQCRVVGLPLGILPDSPPKLREAVLRARDRRAEVLLLAGGVGDGTSDRTRETLQRLEAQMLIDGISLQGASGFLFAKFQGLDILCLSGKPLAAQAQVDLLVRPALLVRLGARRSLWDWSRMDWPASLGTPGAELASFAPGEWSVWPAALHPSLRGQTRVMAWAAPSPFFLLAPGQEGWAVMAPAPPGDPRRDLRAHFQPL